MSDRVETMDVLSIGFTAAILARGKPDLSDELLVLAESLWRRGFSLAGP